MPAAYRALVVISLLLLGVLRSALPAEPAPRVTISGHVRDETGAPVAGANVRLSDESGYGARAVVEVITDGKGIYSASVLLTKMLIMASHPDFGLQWSAMVGDVWDGYSRRLNSKPEGPVDLVLRRGVVVRGRVVDADNRPLANETMLLIPAYVGSGPAPIKTSTDADGRFTFERAVLSRFELVPRDYEQWRPRKAGDFLRIAQKPDSWIATARSGGSLELRVERYRLVSVTIDVSALKTTGVQVSKRWGTAASEVSAPVQVSAAGTVQVLMEQGLAHELWVIAETTGNTKPPWTRGIPRNWLITPKGPMTLSLPAAAARP